MPVEADAAAKLVAVIGSVTPPGRLNRSIVEAATRCADAVEVLDLGVRDIGFAGLPQATADTTKVLDAIAAADGVVLATPVYRATFTGALKNLLDHVPIEALRGKAVGIVAMGATAHHSLGADWHLRDVLAWFGAVVAPTSVYLTSADFEDGAVKPDAAASVDELFATVARLARVLPAAADLGPAPLAARSR
jgi:FMN reductase